MSVDNPNWLNSAFDDHERTQKEKKLLQRQRVIELLDLLSQEENVKKVNYELLLVKKVISAKPSMRDDMVRRDRFGNPIIEYYCALDDFSTSTQNGFDDSDRLASVALGRLTTSLEDLSEDEDDDNDDDTSGNRIAFRNTSLSKLPFEGESELQEGDREIDDWDLVVRVIDGHPLQLGRAEIATVVIHPRTDDADIAFMLGFLKGKINEYAQGV